ncbi:unnamed protein product [Cuscuta epithymum]|uniref:Uncharacterized protein n=1 Tax=Cuscuta epithymum TaxID=186058 RepID=A0AAV0DAU3_9ASTE|nr:unnamed protein product [Cuscuta epithymum]CAH9126211.1 unnamed protein product [Cuscuta epithymum]
MEASDRKEASIPFKWEIQPGVPRMKGLHGADDDDRSNRRRPDLHAPKMLRPPPGGRLFYRPISEPRRSFRSRPAVVDSGACCPSSLLTSWKGAPPPAEYCSDAETTSRRSGSTWKSLSHFSDSPQYFSSTHTSPPRPVNDAEWPTFALL